MSALLFYTHVHSVVLVRTYIYMKVLLYWICIKMLSEKKDIFIYIFKAFIMISE